MVCEATSLIIVGFGGLAHSERIKPTIIRLLMLEYTKSFPEPDALALEEQVSSFSFRMDESQTRKLPLICEALPAN